MALAEAVEQMLLQPALAPLGTAFEASHSSSTMHQSPTHEANSLEHQSSIDPLSQLRAAGCREQKVLDEGLAHLHLAHLQLGTACLTLNRSAGPQSQAASTQLDFEDHSLVLAYQLQRYLAARHRQLAGQLPHQPRRQLQLRQSQQFQLRQHQPHRQKARRRLASPALSFVARRHR